VHSPFFFVGREAELRTLINQRRPKSRDDQFRRAGCRGMNSDAFHPEEGRPDGPVLARCTECQVRLACLALALQAEDPGARSGWYGGLGPADRDDVARTLGLEAPDPPVPDRAVQVRRLRADGWTVDAIAAKLGCSRRTVQRSSASCHSI
jgi:AraC-like DNA-binding protein